MSDTIISLVAADGETNIGNIGSALSTSLHAIDPGAPTVPVAITRTTVSGKQALDTFIANTSFAVNGGTVHLSGSASANNTNLVASTDVSGYDTIMAHFTGTFTATVQFQFSNDNTNWIACLGQVVTSATTAAAVSFTATNAMVRVPVQGRYLRVRTTAYTSGTVNVGLSISAFDIAHLGQRSVSSVQSGTWTVQPGNTANTTAWFVKDNSLGTVAAGTAGTQSSLAGGVFNTLLPTLTNGQQAALQLDSSGRLLVSAALVLSNDTDYGTVGANTLRTAAQIGNATGAASFGAGITTAQVLRVVLPTDQTAIPATQSGPWTVQPGNTQNTTPWLTQDAASLIDNAGFTDGTSRVIPAGFILDETAGTALTENDTAAARIDSKRAQVHVIEDATTRGRRAGVTANSDLKASDGLRNGGVEGLLTLATGGTTYEAKVGVSRLANRKMLTITADDDMFWGYTNGVTTSTGTPLKKNQQITFSIDPDSTFQVWLVASGNNKTARITESP